MSTNRRPKLAGKPQKLRSSADPPAPSAARPPEATSAPPPRQPGEKGGHVDKLLYRNLVDMVPLVESLMDRRGNQSFRRRAAVVVTPNPTSSSKVIDQKGRRMTQTSSVKKLRDRGDCDSNKHKDAVADVLPSAPKSPTLEEDQNSAEEVNALRMQLDELQKKLLEKDEAMKSLKESTDEIYTISLMLNDLKQQVTEKDSSIANVHSQLANTEIKLAEKETALEKLEKEVADSNGRVEGLQGDLDNLEFEINAFRRFFEELSNASSCPEDTVTSFQPANQLSYIDGIDEAWLEKMEEAREAYDAALAAARDAPNDECLGAVVEARLHLCSFLTS